MLPTIIAAQANGISNGITLASVNTRTPTAITNKPITNKNMPLLIVSLGLFRQSRLERCQPTQDA